MSQSRQFLYKGMKLDYVPCPICSGTDFEHLLDIDRYRMGVQTAGCKGCGLVMTHPLPSEGALNHFYKNHYRSYYQSTDVPDVAYIRRYKKDLRAAYTAAYLADLGWLRPNVSVLDYGCAEGSLLKAIREHLPSGGLAGIEPNPAFAEFAGRYTGAKVLPSLDALDSTAPSSKFDLILVNHVLEHLRNPVAFLEMMRARLNPGGSIYVDVPALEAYDSIASIHIGHLYHFSARTLRLTALRAGYEPAVLERHEPPNHPPSIRAVLVPRAIQAANSPMDPGEYYWDRVSGLKRTAWRFFLRRSLPIRALLYIPRRIRRLPRRTAR